MRRKQPSTIDVEEQFVPEIVHHSQIACCCFLHMMIYDEKSCKHNFDDKGLFEEVLKPA